MDNETKEFLVNMFDAKFAEQDKKIDAKFAEQDKKIDAKFEEQKELFDTRFAELTNDVTQIVGEILEEMDRKFKRERKKTDKDIKSKISVL